MGIEGGVSRNFCHNLEVFLHIPGLRPEGQHPPTPPHSCPSHPHVAPSSTFCVCMVPVGVRVGVACFDVWWKIRRSCANDFSAKYTMCFEARGVLRRQGGSVGGWGRSVGGWGVLSLRPEQKCVTDIRSLVARARVTFTTRRTMRAHILILLSAFGVFFRDVAACPVVAYLPECESPFPSRKLFCTHTPTIP